MDIQNYIQNAQWWVPTKKFISDTLLVALLTGVGYLATYAYQYSYLNYFNVPTFFIDINLGLILLTTSVGLVWIAGMGIILNFFKNYKPNRIFFKIIKDSILFFVLIVLILFPIIAAMYNPKNTLLFLIFFFLVLISATIAAIRTHRNPKLFNKKIETRNTNDFIYKAEQIYGSFPVGFVTILIYFILCSWLMGKAIAQDKSEYLVSNTNPKLIIISAYSDGFIGLTFSTTTHKFNNEINILSKDTVSENSIIFSIEKIGRLTSN